MDRAHRTPLLRTKLHRPPVPRDLVARDRLLAELDQGGPRALTLVSAPAGYGKTTLVSHWLEGRGIPCPWVSLDETDSDVRTFLRYVVEAVRPLAPESPQDLSRLLDASQLPPPPVLASHLVNALDAIEEPFVLVLDDYHRIRDTAIHEILDGVLHHPPRSLQLVILSRRSPPLSLAALRAAHRLHELRMGELQFTVPEAGAFLKKATGLSLDETATLQVQEGTEGWPAALRLAALSLRRVSDVDAVMRGLEADGRPAQEFLLQELLSRQSPPLRTWLVRISILDRFCAPLCEAVCGSDGESELDAPDGSGFVRALEDAGLFAVPLDDRLEWYRFHHLFRSLLRRELDLRLEPAEIESLHARAASWLEARDHLEEALQHALQTGDPDAAGQLVVRHRHEIVGREQWHRLDRWLGLLPREGVEGNLELLMLKAWSCDNRGRFAEVARIVDRVEKALGPEGDSTRERALRGEADVLRSYQHYLATEGLPAVTRAESALERLPPEYVSERGYATVMLAMGLQMIGERERAHAVVSEALRQEEHVGGTYHGRMLVAFGLIHWLEADLPALAKVSSAMMTLGRERGLPEIVAFGRYFEGIGHYHHNELEAARAALEPVVADPFSANANNAVRSISALALTYQAQGLPEKATKLVEGTINRLLETGRSETLPAVKALEAELALREGRLGEALLWAAGVDLENPEAAYGFVAPETTQVRVRLREGTPSALAEADSLLECLSGFFQSTHNTRFVIETRALQALVAQARGDGDAATEALTEALQLAQPGGFIRLFVDLGPEMQCLLGRLPLSGELRGYAHDILAAFGEPPTPSEPAVDLPLAKRLSRRELEVLRLLADRLTSDEIGERLFISPKTVKRHVENIFDKIGVRSRREAVAAARRLGVLPVP